MVKINRRLLHDFDWLYLLTSLAIAACGVLCIYSVGDPTDKTQNLWSKQIIWIGCGIILMLIVLYWDYHKLVRYSFIFYGATIVLMLIVTVRGHFSNGHNAWLSIGGFGFQPSELAKIATVMTLTAYLTKQKKDGQDSLALKDIIVCCAIVGLPVLAVLSQHDMGTALTFCPFLFVLMFMSGLRWWMVAAAVLVIAGGLVAAYKIPLLSHYQIERINVIIKPDTVDPKGYGYHTVQSKIAVGSGGLFGKGLKHGTQSQLRFLPYPYTDFIAAALGEELGFAGIITVLTLILFWLMRAINIAQLSRDRMGLLMIMGLVTLFFSHIISNVGMVVGLMPVLGIPLPLMSYGGSSVFGTFIAIGLILNVRLRRFVN